MPQPVLANRDRLAPYLGKLGKLLDNPTPDNIRIVSGELKRIAAG